jgi:hypothetical protein
MRFEWSKYRDFWPFIIVFDGYVGKYYVTYSSPSPPSTITSIHHPRLIVQEYDLDDGQRQRSSRIAVCVVFAVVVSSRVVSSIGVLPFDNNIKYESPLSTNSTNISKNKTGVY